MVMDEDDPDLPYIAVLLQRALIDGGLSPDQGKEANETLLRVYAAWCAGTLECWRPDLADMDTEGQA